MKGEQVSRASSMAMRHHRFAQTLSGPSKESALTVAKALDAAVIRWAESDGVDEPTTEFVAVPMSAISALHTALSDLGWSRTAVKKAGRAIFDAAVDEANGDRP